MKIYVVIFVTALAYACGGFLYQSLQATPNWGVACGNAVLSLIQGLATIGAVILHKD